MTAQLFPREPRRMKQPRKDEIRLRLEISEAQAVLRDTPLWWRVWHRIWARMVEVDRITEADSHKPPVRNPPAQTEPGELL
ncbi:MAG TPA: hypothetical protein VLC71_06140 [Thermomonas sp.]|nr:hypothetical protein [Thermomonas sp.]